MDTQRIFKNFLLFLAVCSLLACPVDAQVFDTVINIPQSPNIISNFANPASVGGDGRRTQINVFDGGTIGTQFELLSGSEVNVIGGSIDSFANVNSDSELNLIAGMLGIGFDANAGSVVNVSGGSVGDFFDAGFGSEVNISGGTVGTRFVAGFGSQINISGGTFDGTFIANSGVLDDSVPAPLTIVGSEINLFGSNFVLNNVPLDDSLVIGDPFTVFNRDVVLSGLLADGSRFSFDLNSVESFNVDFFDPDATLTVTLVSAVPEPGLMPLLAFGYVILSVRRDKAAAV